MGVTNVGVGKENEARTIPACDDDDNNHDIILILILSGMTVLNPSLKPEKALVVLERQYFNISWTAFPSVQQLAQH